MMYTIVALVYLVNLGALPNGPLSLTSKHTFLGLDSCQEYLKSPEFAHDRQSLYATMSQAVTLRHMVDESQPVPDIVITASCQEDNRV